MRWSDVLDVLGGIARLIDILIYWRFWVCFALGFGVASLLMWQLADGFGSGPALLCVGAGALIGTVWEIYRGDLTRG